MNSPTTWASVQAGPTGGDKGNGSLNAVALWQNGVALAALDPAVKK